MLTKLPTHVLSLVLLAIFTTGCGRSNGPVRHDVDGTVTFEGQPIASGVVVFDPDIAKQNKGPQAFARVTQGQFSTADSGKGMVGGPHVLTISGEVGPDPKKPGNILYINHKLELDLPNDDYTAEIAIPASSVKSTLPVPEV
ncbi:hypothetical protein [Aeoliella sp. SH292]|uniref:hypothetical protein n=1 Tax=Aeoliella sp. SH292 TaxID=3454464 RepID=UPI003F9AECDA